MARYLPAVVTRDPATLEGLQPGQWIAYDAGFATPSRGRFYGRRNGLVFIAWGRAATHRFPTFAQVARGRR